MKVSEITCSVTANVNVDGFIDGIKRMIETNTPESTQEEYIKKLIERHITIECRGPTE